MSKQFLLLCDESGMQTLKNVFKDNVVQFLEVQGMNLNNENKLNLLVTPINPPVTPAVISSSDEKEETQATQPTE
jgi:hypothetical protein